LAKADTAIVKGKFAPKEEASNGRELFSIMGKKYSVGDFYTYLKANQSAKQSNDPAFVMEQYYKQFVNKSLTDYEEAHLEEKYEDYRMLLQEYREGILLFSLMEKKVWGKAMEDTAGLRAYFNANRAKYQWNERVKAVVYSCENQKLLDEVRNKLAARTFPVADPKFDAITYDKNSLTIEKAQVYRLTTMAEVLKRDTTLRVEIVGLADGKEKSNLRKRRAKSVADSLIARGVPARLLTVVEGTPAKDAKPEDNQRVSFKVFGSSPKALERVVNAANGPLALKVSEGMYQRTENADVDKTNWTVGDHKVENNGRVAWVRLLAKEAPRAKTLDEAKGVALSDYQNQLEKDWVESLIKASPISYNEEEVKKLIKK
jgi:peptidyl-prolyl cis-trans isomerase SurA